MTERDGRRGNGHRPAVPGAGLKVAEKAVAGVAGPAIQLVDLTKRYRANLAVAGVTMSVPRGEVFGFLGPNGAGKTTVVKLLLGLARPSLGQGAVLGEPLGSREARRRIGYLPELFRYQGWLEAREVLALHCELAGVPLRLRPGAIETALETAGLADRGRDRVETFSKGMQQRLGLAVALLGDPQLVLLDEPTSALDPVGRHDVRDIIRGLKQRGVAVFLNSHLLSEVEQVCDRVAVVDHGRVVAQGPLAELLAAPQVRIRCTGLGGESMAGLRRRWAFHQDGDWLSVAGIAAAEVPDLVAALVSAGARIHAVEPGQQTLEERFLQLVEQP
ncbi:MAG: ABC transporter ATP-binding protein [Candidatus Dormibacteraeota bacterium]|nr:ABC transporter ATP-binding protein [Candidatus Dormibacteraeota bacterium]